MIAREMQRAYETEMQRRANITPAEREALACAPLLPLTGRICRILIYGGGGCGKTRVITRALTPLFRRFYGPKGVALTAFANKPARLLKGKTAHSLTKIRGQQSLTMARLRVQNENE